MAVTPLPLIADVTFSTEGLVIVGGLMTTLATVITFLFRLLYNGVTEERNSWRQMYFTSMEYNEVIRKKNRELTGTPFPAPLAAVVAESSSPPTEKQIATADIATERAKVTALGLEIEGWDSQGAGP